MIKAVIDTNGFLSSIPTNGSNKWLYFAFIEMKFQWVFSNEIMSEYTEMAGKWYGENTMIFVVNLMLSSVNHLKYKPSYK